MRLRGIPIIKKLRKNKAELIFAIDISFGVSHILDLVIVEILHYDRIDFGVVIMIIVVNAHCGSPILGDMYVV